MGWFLRKSFRLGPLRLNLSKRGIGASVGVKGARLGVDAAGKPYAAGGRYGIYFRERLGASRAARNVFEPVEQGAPPDSRGRRWWGLVVLALLLGIVLGVVLARAGDPARVDLFDARGRRTGYAVLDRDTGRVDFFDTMSRRTGYGRVDRSGRVERFSLDGKREGERRFRSRPGRVASGDRRHRRRLTPGKGGGAMARLVKRTWLSRGPTGHKVRKVAWGYTLQVNGQQQRKVCASWGKEEAKDALDARLLELDAPRAPTTEVTFGEAVDRYVKAKSRKKSIAADERQLVRFKAYFGADTPLGAITAARISAWKAEQLSATCPRTKKPFSAAAINRPLAALRHLLKLAYEEWELLRAVPKIRLEKEPQGRIRWLEADEEARLLEACRASRTKHLAQVVTVALETGLRRAELLGLTWDRVDLSRGVIRIETTKSGRRREVPMRQVVYELLAALPGPREGRLWPARKIRTAFESAVTAAGLADFRFHDCRHHFASWFMMRDGGLPALKEVLGHADLKTTLIYAHLSPAHLRSEIAKTERPAMPSPMLEPFSTKSAQERLAAVESGEGASEVADL